MFSLLNHFAPRFGGLSLLCGLFVGLLLLSVSSLVPAFAAPKAPKQTAKLPRTGTVVAWGDNSSGQATVPGGLTGVVAIAAGGSHSLALKSDGTVVAWGSNGHGQTTVPAGLSHVIAIAAGDEFSLAVVSSPGR